MALNSALAIAARSLEVFQTGIEVAGQNIANANTPGYVREELRIESGPDYRVGRVVKGTGANLTGIRLAIQTQLESRIHTANSDLAGSRVVHEAHINLEETLRELGPGDLSSAANELIAALNEFNNEPTLPGLRELVITQGQSFADAVQYTRELVDRQRDNLNTQIEALTEEVNVLVDQIEDLNRQIIHLEGGGAIHSDSGALRSDRLAALDRLSEIVEIDVTERPTGRVDVLVGGEYLILDNTTQGFQTYVPDDNEGSIFGLGVEFSESGYRFLEGGGELTGLLKARDEILGGFTDELDEYAGQFLFEFNKIHSSGSGTTNYTEVVSEHAVDDTTLVLNDVDNNGLDFTAQHGSFNVIVSDTTTGLEQTTNIRIDLDGFNGDDTTFDDLVASLNAVDNLNASVDGNNRLRLTTDAGHEVRFDNDTSHVLAVLGVNTFFSGIDAETINVSDVIKNDSTKLAGGRGGGPGDTTNAQQLIQLFEQPLDQFGGRSLDAQYQTLVAGVAQEAASERSQFEGFQNFHDSLQSQREQYSGVSIDEETVRILAYQQSYQAAARVLSTVNELLQILVNL